MRLYRQNPDIHSSKQEMVIALPESRQSVRRFFSAGGNAEPRMDALLENIVIPI